MATATSGAGCCPQGHALHWTGNRDGRRWCQPCGVYFDAPAGTPVMVSTTRHTHQVVFGRLVNGCPRCDESRAGAPPRTWGGRTYDPVVEKERRRYSAELERTRLDGYCFCPETGLGAGRCSRCGKPPFTD